MEVKGAQIERTEDGAVNDLSVDLFFMKQPELLPLYLEIERAVRDRLGDFEVVVQKSQITWKGPGSFAALWLPRWKRPDGRIYVGLSFFLEFQVESPRIPYSTEPYPNRWTHHVMIGSAEEIDQELLGWLWEAAQFAASKPRKAAGE